MLLLLAVVLIVCLAAFAIANAVFTQDEGDADFSTSVVQGHLGTAASSVRGSITAADGAADKWDTAAQGNAKRASDEASTKAAAYSTTITTNPSS